MKKTILYAAILFLCIIMGLGFKKQQPFDVAKLSANVIECVPTNNFDDDAISFAPDPNEVTLIRKDITSFHGNDSANLCMAIKKMKETKQPGFKSMSVWEFQVKIHGGEKELHKNFGTCQHYGYFFLAWHRMYLYYFEKVLRKYMPKNSSTALPYWDYQTYDMIPPILINPTSKGISNPLYNDTRSLTLNNGGHLSSYTKTINKKKIKGSSINVSINKSLLDTSFYPFQKAIEAPHGSVHMLVGGDMQARETAANDLLFWLHHANVDRLWEKWLEQGEGRCNPSYMYDKKWWGETFTFFDEDGKAVKITGADIVNTVEKLHYRYDIIERPVPQSKCNELNKMVYEPVAKSTAKVSVSNTQINSRTPNKVSFPSLPEGGTDYLGFMPKENGASNFLPNFNTDNIYLEFEDIKTKTMPEGVIEIYLSTKNKTELSPDEPGFVGLLDLFTANAIEDKATTSGANNQNVLRIRLNDVIKLLKFKITDFRKVKVFFLVRGNSLNDEEVITNVDVSIGKMSLAFYK
jgi:tyrosinase